MEGMNARVPVVIVMRVILYFRGDHGCGGTECSGPSQEIADCKGNTPRHCMYRDWGEWTSCSDTTCGGTGTKTRARETR